MLIQAAAPTIPEPARNAEAASAPAAPGRISDVRGVIDNATPDRLYGWAWDHGYPTQRVRVALRIAGETLAEAAADGARPDLAKAGIGDGCHAFELPLRPAWRDRLQDLTVVAFGGDGHEFPIAVRLPRQPTATTPVQRTIESVVAEQRELRRQLVALQEQSGGRRGERTGDQAGDQTRERSEAAVLQALQDRVQHLEVWLTRLDARMADMAAPPPAAAGTRIDPWQAVLYALLASLSAGALTVAALRWMA